MLRRAFRAPPSLNVASGMQRRHLSYQQQTKMLTGAGSAGMSATFTLSCCHLFLTPITLNVALGVVGGAIGTGALSAFEGGADQESGTGFGAVTGIFLACIGAYYCKVVNEPWRR